ncbi:MAG: short-chain dehydrogenase/reductase [Thalassobaculum sp.]|uniref:short-chain dehydrogenase/reductase n=1 Tax=Thalassobaculum sp. TaxID=2022740 RepID=UPI0032EB685A
MDLQIAGKRVVVTGGSKGIGLAVAEAFLGEGATVTLVARDAGRLDEAAKGLPGHVATMALDLSKPADREKLAAEHGDADVLVNNAGAIPGGGLFDIDMARWEQAWALKVMGYIHLTQLYLARMKERGDGTILNVIGMAGRQPRWDYVCGGAGNAALNAFTNAVGGKSPEWGVRVFGIHPAATRTDRIVALSKSRAKTAFGDESRWEEMLTGLPFGRPAEPEEIAAMAVMLASPKVAYLSGTVIDVDGGAQFR